MSVRMLRDRKVPNEFRLNLVLEIFTVMCPVNLMLVHIDII
jgi:hypothetical protein